MSVSIRRMSAADVGDLRAYHDLYVRAERAVLPDASTHSVDELRAILGPAAGGMWFEALVAEDEELVGSALLSGSVTDNLHAGSIAVWVPPEHSGRGVGSALLSESERRMIKHGRREITTEIILGGNGSAANRSFAEARGYEWAYSEIERRLPLPIPEARLNDLEVEERRRTPQTLAGQDAEIVASGRRRASALALAADGSVVALTTCVLPAPGDDEVEQWGTVVDRDHRGHRLGLSIKIACCRLLQQLPGDQRSSRTGNAETNWWMIAINDALGFRVQAERGVFVRRLPAAD